VGVVVSNQRAVKTGTTGRGVQDVIGVEMP
jgi:hypothetical protein